MSKARRARIAKVLNPKRSPTKPRDGATQDWSDVLKGATPEKLAEALTHPRKAFRPSQK